MTREFAAAFDQEGRSLRSELWIVMLAGIVVILIFHSSLLDMPGRLLPWTPLLLIGIGIPVVLRWLSGAHSPLRRWSAALFIIAAYLDTGCVMAVRIMGVRDGDDAMPLIVPVCLLMSLVVAQIRFVVLVPVILTGLFAIAIAELLAGTVTSSTLFDLTAAAGIVCLSLASAYELETSSRTAWLRQRELNELTRVDSLTGLPNRRHLEKVLSEVIGGSDPVVVAIFDIDEFKALNDELGHPAGDECLRAIGALLRDRINPVHEFVARYAGEEFVAAWWGIAPESARVRAELLRRSIGELGIARPESGGTVTASAGTAELRTPESLISGQSTAWTNTLIDRADHALYEAKAAGRNTIVHDREVITAADPRIAAPPATSTPDDDLTEWPLHAGVGRLYFERTEDEARFREVFEEQGRRTRRLIMAGFLIVVAILTLFAEPLLRLPAPAANFGRWVNSIAFIPAGVLAMVGASWRRLRNWSSLIYIAAVAVILTGQMFERVVQTPKGFNVVPFLMPISVLLSLCVVRIVYNQLVPAISVLLVAVIVCEVLTMPMTGNAILTMLTSVVMVFVAVRFAYRLEKFRRSGWSRSRQLEDLGMTDPVTGLPNRRSFTATFHEQVAGGGETALLLLDIDRFKEYNDRFGHLAGDDCLRVVGAQLRHATAARCGIAARLGGEEFAVILPASADQITGAEQIRAAVTGRRVDADRPASHITISGGLALWSSRTATDPGTAVDDLISRADQALYQAKRDGRDRLVVDSGHEH